MSDSKTVISLQKHKRAQLAKKGKQSSLCGNGFHSWELLKEQRFDVKEGKLVTGYRCKRCGVTKTQAH